MSRIVWLASYPKSGNTWLRALLANFEADDHAAADINTLRIARISSDRHAADDALGVESSDLAPEELDRYRPAVYRHIAKGTDKALFIKAHDAYTFNCDAEPLFPTDVTRAAVYLVRNPLDVAVSFAHHENRTVDYIIDRMSRGTAALAHRRDRLYLQLPQRLTSWSEHVLSWIDQGVIPVRVIRYEDMSSHPVEEFAETVRFIGMEADVERVRRAVALSSFETLRQQELKQGFRERPQSAVSFFRSGRVDGWRETLTKTQVERLVHDHGAVMRRLGYLPDLGVPE